MIFGLSIEFIESFRLRWLDLTNRESAIWLFFTDARSGDIFMLAVS